ncbi:MAG TPA: hypothetical protein P5298_10455 [Spirochaetia bacterium]|nr:hypothetical protein [Spirochaetales bacterium]HRW24821.1 hypothetical protein [Spirochaetia bacterium]
MKKTIACGSLLVAALLLAASCASPFVMDAKSLKGQTISYYGSDGHDVDTFAFSADGLSGTWVQEKYSLAYPDAAAEASGDYSEMTWYRRGGFKASFTYNPETFDIVVKTTEIYGRSAEAIDADTYYASDYAYQTPAAYYSLNDSVSYSAYAVTTTTKAVFTQDICSLLFQSYGRAKAMAASESLETAMFGDGGSWSYDYVEATAYTLTGGQNGGSVDTTTASLTLSATSLSYGYVETVVETLGGVETSRYTERSRTDYTVGAARLVGSTDPDDSFDDVWKEGNAVTFSLTMTRDEYCYYNGTTEPDAPAADADGYNSVSGANADGEYYYRIDLVPYGTSMSIARNEGYVVDPSFLSYAGREL